MANSYSAVDAVVRTYAVKLFGMLPDQLFAGRAIETVNLVIRHIAVDPLDIGSKLAQHIARTLRRTFELITPKPSRAGHFPFYHELRHDHLHA